MVRFFRGVTVVLVAVLLAPLAFGGFEKTTNFGARAAGMGGIAIAHNNTISAAFYNPAHFKYVETWVFGVDFLPTITSSSVGLPAALGGTQNADFFFLPIFNAAGAYRINDKFVVGIGVYTPAGLATKYSGYGGGAAPTIPLVKVDFKVIEAAPFIVFEPIEGFAIAIQWRPTYAIYDQTVGGLVHKSLDRFEFLAGRFAISHTINDNWQWGFAVRSLTKTTLTGTTTVPPLIPAGTAISLVDVVLPWELFLGLAYMADDQAFTIAFDVGYRTYSQVTVLDFDIALIPGNEGVPPAGVDVPVMFNDSFVGRLGAEIKVAERWFVRFGGTIATPATSKAFDSPLLTTPGIGLVGGAGFGYMGDGWSIDMSYDFTTASQTVNPPFANPLFFGSPTSVKRSNVAHALGVSINIFGKKKAGKG